MQIRRLLSAVFATAVVPTMCFMPGPAIGEIVGVATVAEGASFLLRDDGYFTLESGVDIDEGDVIRTGPGGRAQLEMADGSVLEVGESSELYLSEYQLQDDESIEVASLSLITGFLRFVTSKIKASRRYEVNTATATIGVRGTQGVVETNEVVSSLLLETGQVDVFEVNDAGELGASWIVRGGEAVTRERGKSVERRDAKHLRKSLPEQFRKAVKRRKAFLKRRGVTPKKLRAVDFEDLQRLLKSNPRMRKNFKQRFESELRDPAFRRKLERQFDKHADWQWLLHDQKTKGQPEKDERAEEKSSGNSEKNMKKKQKKK